MYVYMKAYLKKTHLFSAFEYNYTFIFYYYIIDLSLLFYFFFHLKYRLVYSIAELRHLLICTELLSSPRERDVLCVC